MSLCPVQGCTWGRKPGEYREQLPDHIVEAHGMPAAEKDRAPDDDEQLTLTGATKPEVERR